MPLADVTNDNFDSMIDTYPLMVLDFWAPWCAPCKAFSPVYAAAAEEHPDVLFGRINTDVEKDLAKQFEVRSIPTILAAKNGTIVQVKVGSLNPTSLAALVAELRR